MRGVPVIPHYDLDATLSAVIDRVITQALDATQRGVVIEPTEGKLLAQAGEVLDRQKHEGSGQRETVS
jgi:hypothetical protein